MKVKVVEKEYPGGEVRRKTHRLMQPAICKAEGFTKKEKPPLFLNQ